MSLIEENPLLKEVFAGGSSSGSAGKRPSVHSHIFESYAEALYRAVLRVQPLMCLEIGMAFGVSSLAILTALRKNGRGRLISIDPYQTSQWSGSGLDAVRKSGLQAYHEVMEQPDFSALPILLDQGTQLEFAYVDGWHTFDYTLLDFFYIDKMLRVGGVVAFNDCGWLGVDRVLRFVQLNRKYVELSCGLSPANRWKHRLRRWLGGPAADADRYFEKLETWQPKMDFYAPVDPAFRPYTIVSRFRRTSGF
jgi:predicted O-methyltransferase YrrM